MKTAGGTDGHYSELKAVGLGTPLDVLSYNAGAFKSDPPRAADLSALLSFLHDDTSLVGPDAWADPTSVDANDMRLHLRQAQMLSQVFMACRAVEKQHIAQFCRSAGVDTEETRDEQVVGKKADLEAQRLMALASSAYNFDFARDAVATTEALLRTRDALKMNRFELSPLRSVHYGAVKPSGSLSRRLVHDSSGSLVEQDEELTLSRSGASIIFYTCVCVVAQDTHTHTCMHPLGTCTPRFHRCKHAIH